MGAFADIDTIWEYRQLLDKAAQIKPYRNTGALNPKYPLGTRRYSDRYFKPRLDLIKHEDINPPTWYNYYDKPPIEIYYTDRYMLGTFHPDNTFEFNPSVGSYNQGDTGVVSSVLPGWITSKANYGGLVFYHRQTRTAVPVYENMRIRLCDGMPTDPFELHVNTLDRKKTKSYRAKYDEMFKLSVTMLKAMGSEAIAHELHEMIKGQVAPAFNYKHEELSKAYDSNDPAGAVMWLAMRYNISNCRYAHHYQGYGFRRFLSSLTPEVLVRNVKNYFYKEIYNEAISKGEDVLKSKIYRYGDKLPTAEWGQKIIVNGVVHKRLV